MLNNLCVARMVRAVACVGLLGLAAVAARGEDARFSQRIPASESIAAGFGRLTSDQLAVLDALVRRDETLQMRVRGTAGEPGRFSQRLPADERLAAGLNLLTPAEVAHLDALVAADEAGVLPPPGGDETITVVTTRRPAPQIHGEISLSVGGGSGGYHEIGGSMDLFYDDPAHGFTLAVGYSEWRASGGYFGGVCGGPLLRRARSEVLPPSR